MRYVIASTARSRSFWLSKALSYLEEICLHDPLRDITNLGDIPRCSGFIDTGIVFFKDKFLSLYPYMPIIVIERPVEEVVKALKKKSLPSDWAYLAQERLEELKQRAVLVVPYNKINKSGELIWNACQIPYDFDENWWTTMCTLNLQCEIKRMESHPLFPSLEGVN